MHESKYKANKEEYMKRRNEARKICRGKEREMINNGIRELKTENRRNKNRKKHCALRRRYRTLF
jgi:hypothetical protein